MTGDPIAPPWRVPLLAGGFASLALGTLAGLARVGWPVPGAAAAAAALHGPLMICGFFGVVIPLERAVAIGRPWAYAAPLAAALAGVAVIAGEVATAAWLYLAAAVVFVAASAAVWHRQRALFTATMVLGALCWLVGLVLWAAGSPVHAIIGWWLAFPVLTIAGERLELSRFLPPSPIAARAFVGILALVGVGLAGLPASWGAVAFAAGLLALSGWLVRQDIARRTVRGRGLTRFIAVCLLSGYAWLAIGAGTILAAGALAPGTPSYDAALHALLLGFVFSMVFGHAPIIFPAVLRVAVPYQPGFYAPLVLLHASLAIRLAGDATGRFEWTRAGAMLNALALASFVVGTAAAVIRGRRASSRK